MDRGRVCVAFVLILSLACSTAHARKVLLCGHGGGPLRGWFAVKVVETHDEPKLGLGARDRLLRYATKWLGLRERFVRQEESWQFQRTLRDIPRIPFEERPLLGFPHEEKPLLMLHRPVPRLHVEERPDFSSLVGVSQSFICDTCLDISTFAEQVLTDPETVNNVLEYVNSSLCEVLPGLQEQCSGLAATYVPEVFQMLQVYVAPDKLCGDTNLCPSSSMLLLGDDRTCAMCQEFATEALAYLNDNKTETEVLAALHLACSKLGELSSRCNLLVNAYAPLIITKVELSTPEQVCEKVRLCTTVSAEKKSRCATCEYAVYEMKAKLRSPAVRAKMTEMLLDGCSKVPDHVDQCKEIVTLYGPFILASIDTFLDADTVCTMIHACEATPASNVTPAVREKATKDSTEFLIQLPADTHHGAASQ